MSSSNSEDDIAGQQVVVGLGNPGDRYLATRHNIGFRVIEELARRGRANFDRNECNSLLAEVEGCLLVKPQTFMNRSGFAVRCLRERFELPVEAFLIVYDEVNLPLGHLRLRQRGSTAGHRGLESILENQGTGEVVRLRLGVGSAEGPPAGDDLVEYVLGNFAESEQDTVDQMVQRAADACELWLAEGANAAMQKFNGPPPAAD